MAFEPARGVLGTATVTTAGQSGGIQPQGMSPRLNLMINVTAATGTLDLTVEWSNDGGFSWAKGDPSDAFTQITAVGGRVRQVVVKGAVYRLVWAVTGSFTFSASEYLT